MIQYEELDGAHVSYSLTDSNIAFAQIKTTAPHSPAPLKKRYPMSDSK
jgi:hypothetical protein